MDKPILFYDVAGNSVKIENVYGDTDDAGGNTYGQVVEGAPVKVNGHNLYAARATSSSAGSAR